MASQISLSIDFLPMPHFDYIHDESLVFDRIDNPINALTNTIAVLIAGEFFTAGRTRGLGQGLNTTNNPLAVLFIRERTLVLNRLS